MSGRPLPRRLTVAFAAAVLLQIASGAAAQSTPPSERLTTARTAYGTPNAVACAERAGRGEATEQALADCTRAIDQERLVRSDQAALLINRGAIHLRRREGEAALADFDAVIRMIPRHAEAHLNRGAALIMLGQPGPAVAAITEALTLGVREPHKAYYNRGAAREALGDLRGAYEDYSTALEIQPDWGLASQELERFVRLRRERLASVVGDAPSDGGAQEN